MLCCVRVRIVRVPAALPKEFARPTHAPLAPSSAPDAMAPRSQPKSPIAPSVRCASLSTCSAPIRSPQSLPHSRVPCQGTPASGASPPLPRLCLAFEATAGASVRLLMNLGSLPPNKYYVKSQAGSLEETLARPHSRQHQRQDANNIKRVTLCQVIAMIPRPSHCMDLVAIFKRSAPRSSSRGVDD